MCVLVAGLMGAEEVNNRLARLLSAHGSTQSMHHFAFLGFRAVVMDAASTTEWLPESPSGWERWNAD